MDLPSLKYPLVVGGAEKMRATGDAGSWVLLAPCGCRLPVPCSCEPDQDQDREVIALV